MALNEQTDSELVTASLADDRAAFAELVRRYQDAVFGLALGMTRNREDAADMAQDTFIRAYKKLDRYDSAYPFRPWILRICANLTKNLFRKRVHRRATEEKHQLQIEIEYDTASPDYDELEAALAKLPPKLGVPLRLKYMEDLSYDEIATVAGIGVSAAKMRVLRAKQQMMEYLK